MSVCLSVCVSVCVCCAAREGRGAGAAVGGVPENSGGEEAEGGIVEEETASD